MIIWFYQNVWLLKACLSCSYKVAYIATVTNHYYYYYYYYYYVIDILRFSFQISKLRVTVKRRGNTIPSHPMKESY